MGIPWGFRRGDSKEEEGGALNYGRRPLFFLPHSNRLGIWILVAGSFFSPLSSFRPNCERKVSFLDFLSESFHN